VDFDAVLEQNVGRILAEIDRLDEIARAFSRYGTAPAERPPAEPVDVAAVARDVIALERMGHDDDGDAGRDGGRDGGRAGERAGPAPVSWLLDVDERPVVAFARDEELREVLLNILENARLAHARSVRVRVSRDVAPRDRAPGDGGPGEGGEDRVTLVVADDGVGIAPEALPRVFEPHFSTRTSGSGLGLAISRRIIDGWGGSIGIASEPGVGTTVTIALRPQP
jgi:signal transduction histidine kinase